MIIETFGNTYTRDPMSLGQAEKKCIEAVKNRIRNEGTYQSNLVVNLTWFWYKEEKFGEDFLRWVERHSIQNSTKIYFTAYIDVVGGFRDSDLFQKISRLGHEISFEGFGERWYSLFPAWLKKYNDDEIALNSHPKYTFLSYNRKPTAHRIELIKTLIEKNIYTQGWITFEKEYFPEIDHMSLVSDLDLYPTRDLVEYFQEADSSFSRPEDVRTLGNIEIWNNSYCVIVSETTIIDPWHISEKTWKPILGMRPYLLNACPEIVNILRNLGFYTPGELFNDSQLDNCNVDYLSDHLKRLSELSHEQLYDMWLTQKEMLVHNRNRFLELAVEWNFCD